jgi:hypothetical protein
LYRRDTWFCDSEWMKSEFMEPSCDLRSVRYTTDTNCQTKLAEYFLQFRIYDYLFFVVKKCKALGMLAVHFGETSYEENFIITI